MLIRQETPDDVDAIDAVHRAAFPAPDGGGDPVEVGLVRALRDDPDSWLPNLSLVAEGPDGSVVGHVVATGAYIDEWWALGLGPLGVLPSAQRTGVGSALMHAALGAADSSAFTTVGLLGDPAYYARFGFQAAAGAGVVSPDPAWGDHFQVRRLSHWHPNVTGTFRYAPAFDGL